MGSRRSIRVNILTNFIFLIIIVVALLLGLQYYYSQKLALSAIDKNFNQTSDKIVSYIARSEDFTKKIINLLSLDKDIQEHPQRGKLHPALEVFINIMKTSPNINSMYIGYTKDEFYQVINLKNNDLIGELYNAPKNSHWAVINIIGKEVEKDAYVQFLNKDLNIISMRQLKIEFKPTSRLWYKEALASNEVVRTNIYKFKFAQTYGLTFAKKLGDSDMVVSLDYTLDKLDFYLKQLNFEKRSNIILYEKNGERIASSQTIEKSKWNELFNFLKENSPNKIHTYVYKGLDNFIYHSLSDSHKSSSMHIGIIVPKKDLLAPYMQMIVHSIYVAIAFLLLTLPLIFYSTSLIIKPIRDLMAENTKIENRKFNEVSHIGTHITEFYDLSTSFVSMSQSIQEYQKMQEKLLDSFIILIADAIDTKSSYTGGHCKRVPEIALMLTKVANEKKDGPFKDFSFETEDEWREFYIGAWLHDCGKVTTPEYVVDKATKLETINNRIHEIRTRFEVLFRDAQISYLNSQLKGKNKKEALEKLKTTQQELFKDFEFLATSNMGGEFMSKDKQDRIKLIAQREWIRNFDDRLGLSAAELIRYENVEVITTPAKEKLLSDKQEHIVKRENFDHVGYKAEGFKDEVPEHLYNYGEIYNLCLEKGTLTNEERFKINEHVIMSIKMLEQLPLPDHLARVPEYAGTHHETLIGTGYPKRLTKAELSIPARIMTIADIFEALTATDRPYKKAKTLSETLKIMSFMVKDEHIDSELFKLFLESGVYLEYAKKNLQLDQMDEVDISLYIPA